MKTHYCPVDKTTISYEGECNWCGEKDTSPKELSDEEIHDIWKSLWEGGNIGHIAYNYARAI